MSRVLSLLSRLVGYVAGALTPVELSGGLGLSGDEIVGQLVERG